MTRRTPEQIKVICDMYQSGLTAAQIAGRLGTSRNTICGTLARHGQRRGHHPPVTTPRERLPKVERPKVAPVPRQETPASTESTRHRGPVLQKIMQFAAARDARALPMEAPPQPRGKRPTIFELKADDCRWPFGDPRHPDFHFCGEHKEGKGSYCAQHAALACGVVSVSGGEDDTRTGRPGRRTQETDAGACAGHHRREVHDERDAAGPARRSARFVEKAA